METRTLVFYPGGRSILFLRVAGRMTATGEAGLDSAGFTAAPDHTKESTNI